MAGIFSAGTIASAYYYHISNENYVSKIILCVVGSCCLASYIFSAVTFVKMCLCTKKEGYDYY